MIIFPRVLVKAVAMIETEFLRGPTNSEDVAVQRLECGCDLIDRAIAGEEHAWQQINRELVPIIQHWVRRGIYVDGFVIKSSIHDAEDISQDVLARLCQNLNQFDREKRCSKFRAWLYAVTRNAAIDFHRKRIPGKGMGGSQMSEIMQSVPAADSFLKTGSDSTMRILIEQALEQMVNKHRFSIVNRDLFIRHMDTELPYCDLASEFGMTETAARAAVCRAKKKLKQLLVSAEKVRTAAS